MLYLLVAFFHEYQGETGYLSVSLVCAALVCRFPFSHEDLRHAFGKFGRVIDVTVPVNYHTGRPKGFAFVEYPFHKTITLKSCRLSSCLLSPFILFYSSLRLTTFVMLKMRFII